MLVIKGRVSGFVWAKHTRDQAPEEAFKAIVDWCHRFGLPHSVRFYGRRSFHSRFIEKLKQMGIQHIYTSLYHSKSNGGVGQAIKSVKHCLTSDQGQHQEGDIGDGGQNYFLHQQTCSG